MPSEEAELQKEVIKGLNLKRIFHYRNNSGAMVSEYKGKRSFVKFGATGSPDIICVINGIYVGLEIKSPKGVMSEGQVKFREALEKAGGRYYLIKSIDDFLKVIAEL